MCAKFARFIPGLLVKYLINTLHRFSLNEWSAMSEIKNPKLIVVGGGLAGAEAAFQAAKRGIHVLLYEMRPEKMTPAHTTGKLAELICSNSLGSNLPDRAGGILKNELRKLDSLLIKCADMTSVPAGTALAVDRNAFADCVTEYLESHPNVTIIREEVCEVPAEPAIIATGPLTSNALSISIQGLTGRSHLYFYDAISPIVYKDSIDFSKAFYGSRYGKGENERGDYINCPFTKEEYYAFVKELISAERIELKSFEKDIHSGVLAGKGQFFEGCLPIEVIAARGEDALAYGPLRPVGFIDPRTGKRPYAIVQLRQDNLAGDLFNIVGFQTNLTFPEQRRIFRMIPGLENARFARLGQMHRNTYIFSPQVLSPTMRAKERDDLWFAGQITGAEGYAGNIATGLVAGINAARKILGKIEVVFPRETMIGALCYYITHASAKDFQPMKANLGILPELDDAVRGRRKKKERAKAYADRAKKALEWIIESQNILG